MKAPQKSVKINEIESLEDQSEFVRIIPVLLSNVGLLNIDYNDKKGIITSKGIVPGIGDQQFAFVPDIKSSLSEPEVYQGFVANLGALVATGIYSRVIVVSNKYISTGQKQRVEKELKTQLIEFWGRDEVIEKIDVSYNDYWKHSDQDLLAYEKFYSDDVQDDYAFSKLKQFKATHEKLYGIFVEPRLFIRSKDKESPEKFLVSAGIDKIRNIDESIILEGEPGSGKTRLLRELGRLAVQENETKIGKKNLPVFLSQVRLVESKGSNGKIDVSRAVISKLTSPLSLLSIEDIIVKYDLLIIIDSIDDFDKKTKERIFRQLRLLLSAGAKLVLGTRMIPSLLEGIEELGKYEEVLIQKFNAKQVRLFLSKYFNKNSNSADNLVDSLKENKILERLPVTPLNLALISILYEENNFEIPATITDI